MWKWKKQEEEGTNKEVDCVVEHMSNIIGAQRKGKESIDDRQ